MLNYPFRIACMAVLSLHISAAAAVESHQHSGDIQPYLNNGQIELGSYLYEADFGDLSGGLYRTDDPGFDADTDSGAFGAGNWLWFSGLEPLKYWDGSSWSHTLPNGEYLEIEDALGNITTFTNASVSNPNGVVGAFDSFGDIHEHLDFSIRNATDALSGSIGAYLISLQLFESLPNSDSPLAESMPFQIVFNRGLDSESYETAVAAATAPVPLPGAIWMFGAALFSAITLGRRNRPVMA